jgi:hypothetical protein
LHCLVNAVTGEVEIKAKNHMYGNPTLSGLDLLGPDFAVRLGAFKMGLELTQTFWVKNRATTSAGVGENLARIATSVSAEAVRPTGPATAVASPPSLTWAAWECR